MKEEKLKELLEKYYNGKSSEEEEAILREYFSGEEILPGFEADSEIFSYYATGNEIVPPSDDLEARIIRSVDTLERNQKFRTGRLVILSAAATLLMLIGSYFFLTSGSGIEDTYDDPQVAYLEARRILYDVSVRLNKGTQALQTVERMNIAAEAGMKSVEKSADLISGRIDILENLGKLLNNNDH